jgi:hypothetical protein
LAPLFQKIDKTSQVPVYLTKLISLILGCIDHSVLGWGIAPGAHTRKVAFHVRHVALGVHLLLIGGN